MGGPTLSPLSQMALQVWEWCQLQRISPHAEHLPGNENVLADWESWHTCDSSDWKLLPLVFKPLNSLLGPFSVDLFASRINNQLPVYYSWKPDPLAKAVDAFSAPWSTEHPYLFPPFNLIRRALAKIQAEAVNCASLIAPAWPAQGWYPQLLEMLMKEPILRRSSTRPSIIPSPTDSRRENDVDCLAHLQEVYTQQNFSGRVADILLQS